MKKIIAIVIAVVCTYFLMRGLSGGDNQPEAKTPVVNTDSINAAAVALVMKEPKVKDATITSADVLYAVVLDDGTDRSGYASYLCQVIKDAGADVSAVKIVKLNSQDDPNRDNAYGIELGRAICN